jgi:hypothetical protein
MTYQYLILAYQPSLADSARECFAVLVEGMGPENRWLLVCRGRKPETLSPGDPVATTVAEDLPDILNSIVTSTTDGRVLERLAGYFVWNFAASKIYKLADDDPIDQVAAKLYSTHIEQTGQLVSEASHSSTSRQSKRIDEVFRAVIPIPEPTQNLFASTSSVA